MDALRRGAPENLTAIAVLGGPEHMGLLGSFPEVIDSLLFPLWLFTDEDEAIECLSNHLSQAVLALEQEGPVTAR